MFFAEKEKRQLSHTADRAEATAIEVRLKEKTACPSAVQRKTGFPKGKRKLLFYLSRGFTPQFYYTELQGEITTESSKNFFENFCSHLVITLFFDKKYF